MATTALTVSSPAFGHGDAIPVKYSCEGDQVNPALIIENIPLGTKSLTIIAEDPDAPKGIFDHWLLWNIPALTHIEENTKAGISGLNGSGKTGYHPPCPPNGSHRYYFHVYALGNILSLAAGSDKKALQDAMKKHILAQGELMGRYEKVRQ